MDWLRAHLTADTVPAAEGEGWIIFHLGPQQPAVIVLPPEPPLPVAGLQAVLRLVQSSPLSLVEECRGSALIGREDHSVATPALLCHKEPARASKAPY